VIVFLVELYHGASEAMTIWQCVRVIVNIITSQCLRSQIHDPNQILVSYLLPLTELTFVLSAHVEYIYCNFDIINIFSQTASNSRMTTDMYNMYFLLNFFKDQQY